VFGSIPVDALCRTRAARSPISNALAAYPRLGGSKKNGESHEGSNRTCNSSDAAHFFATSKCAESPEI